MSAEVTTVTMTTDRHERSQSDSEDDDGGRDSAELIESHLYVSESMKNNSLPMTFKLNYSKLASSSDDASRMATPPLLQPLEHVHPSNDSLLADTGSSDALSYDNSLNDTFSRGTQEEEEREEDDVVVRRFKPDDLLLPSPSFTRKTAARHSRVLETGNVPSIFIPPVEPLDDDVFQCSLHNVEEDRCHADKKLVDWALHVYVPACRALLQHCATKKVDSAKILSDIRNLTNTINFFCTEHQKQNEIRSTFGLSPSHAGTGAEASRSHNTSPVLSVRSRLFPTQPYPQCILNPVPNSQISFSAQESEASVAVKVLRTVSSSLLPSLLKDAENGFSKELYKNIVLAIQKISWKVEACLSYNHPGESYDVHKRIFDAKQTGLVGSMMTALPPEEPNFHTSPSHFVRGGSKRSSKRRHVVVTSESEQGSNCTQLSPVRAIARDSALEETPQDLFAISERSSVRHSGDSSSLSDDFRNHEELGSPTTSGVESDDYFRPKHMRRTTISLSKREVKSLGLHLMKPVDASGSKRHHRSNTMGAIGMMGQLQMMEDDDEMGNLRRVRDRVKKKIAKDFPGMEREMCHTPIQTRPSLSEMREDGEDTGDKGPESSEDAGDLLSPLHTTSPLTIHQQPLGRVSLISDMSLDPDYILVERPPSSASNAHHRTRSLGDTLDATQTSSSRVPMAVTAAGSLSPDTKDRWLLSSSTMPSKRKSVFSKLVKKKGSKSFGKSDTVAKKRRGIRTRTSSIFADETFDKEPLFLESIEKFSRNVQPKTVQLEREESCQLVLTVELTSSKVTKSKRKASITADLLSSNLLLEITVCSDMPELNRQGEYKILRTQKDLLTLYDTLEEYCTTQLSPGTKSSLKFPDRPDKKKLFKKKERKQNAEELLRFFARRPELRTSDPFISFLKPDDMFSTLQHKDSEFDLLITFYTPLEYNTGAAGSHHEVYVIEKDYQSHPPSLASTPTAHSTSSKKYSSLAGGLSSVHVDRVLGSEEDEVTLMIKEEGHPVLLVTEEESRYVVMAGRFEKLVEQLACQQKPDPWYVSTFVLGYRHFSTGEDLLSLLIRRFQMSIPPNASEEEMAYAEKWRYVIQLRVLDVISFWMKTCWEDFHRNVHMLDKLKQLISGLKNAEDPNFNMAGISMENLMNEKLQILVKRGLPSPTHSCKDTLTPKDTVTHKDSSSSAQTTPRHTPTATPVVTPITSPAHSHTMGVSNGYRKQLSMDMNTLTAIQLARQLTLIELEFLKAIDVYEIAVYTWESNSPANKPYRRNLDAYISRFNKVSYWVASEICSVHDERLRGTLIEKFIEVAKYCLEYKNFNTLISVVTGISLSAVRRLKKSWEHVSEKSVKSYQRLKELTDPVHGFSVYRKALAAVSPQSNRCIPYFGVFMRDVTLYNEGNPKRLKNGLLNFAKLRALVMMFEELKHFQRSKYFFPSDERTRHYCIELVICMSEQELYDTSLALEPRETEQQTT